MVALKEETKVFAPEVLASITTGVLFCDGFDKLHEAAEWVAGHSIWTHEFASESVTDQLRQMVLEQHPELIEADEMAAGTDPDNVSQKIDAIRVRFPDGLAVRRGHRTRDKGPLQTLKDLVGDKPIITVDPGES